MVGDPGRDLKNNRPGGESGLSQRKKDVMTAEVPPKRLCHQLSYNYLKNIFCKSGKPLVFKKMIIYSKKMA